MLDLDRDIAKYENNRRSLLRSTNKMFKKIQIKIKQTLFRNNVYGKYTPVTQVIDIS